MTLQDISLDGYAEAGGGSTALSYGDQDANSLVGRVGWQLRVEGDRLQPYARLTWDHEFEKPEQASAMLQSLPVAGSYTVPGLNLDRDYGTACSAAACSWGRWRPMSACPAPSLSAARPTPVCLPPSAGVSKSS
jgi:outer membrane autotransporter barrel domain